MGLPLSHGDQWFGLSPARRDEVLGTADILVNVSSSLADPGAYRHIPRLLFIDSDPVFTQVKVARDPVYFGRLVDLHDVHFSFGERLAGQVPDTGHDWRPTGSRSCSRSGALRSPDATPSQPS